MKCPNCNLQMIEKHLFTSSYWECVGCDKAKESQKSTSLKDTVYVDTSGSNVTVTLPNSTSVTPSFKVGDKVKINNPSFLSHGKDGIILACFILPGLRPTVQYNVKVDNQYELLVLEKDLLLVTQPTNQATPPIPTQHPTYKPRFIFGDRVQVNSPWSTWYGKCGNVTNVTSGITGYSYEVIID